MHSNSYIFYHHRRMRNSSGSKLLQSDIAGLLRSLTAPTRSWSCNARSWKMEQERELKLVETREGVGVGARKVEICAKVKF